jgi:putative transcriptional regulator
MTRKYRSEAHAAIHETMEALQVIGAIDKQTMREFDKGCLTPIQALPPDTALTSSHYSTAASKTTA